MRRRAAGGKGERPMRMNAGSRVFVSPKGAPLSSVGEPLCHWGSPFLTSVEPLSSGTLPLTVLGGIGNVLGNTVTVSMESKQR